MYDLVKTGEVKGLSGTNLSNASPKQKEALAKKHNTFKTKVASVSSSFVTLSDVGWGQFMKPHVFSIFEWYMLLTPRLCVCERVRAFSKIYIFLSGHGVSTRCARKA